MSLLNAINESENILSKQVEVDDKTGYSFDPEIRKVQEHADKLDIISLIKNIVHNGDASINDSGETEWEGCTLKYKYQLTRRYKYRLKGGSSWSGSLALGTMMPVETIAIIMKDGTELFAAQVFSKDKNIILAFRNGAWVERLQEYSEQLTSQFKQNLQDKENARKEAQLKPFTDVDF